MNFVDFEKILAAEENYPYTKMRLADPDGNTENLWVRDLGGGKAMLSNDPLTPTHHYRDIVRNPSGEVLFRPYPVKLGFRYVPMLEGDPIPDPENPGKTMNVDYPRRTAILDAIFSAVERKSLVSPSFFSAGMGFILLAEEVDLDRILSSFPSSFY